MIDPLILIPAQKELRHEWWSAVVRNSICKQIRMLRESRGWTQEQLAEKLGTSQGVVSKLENPNFKNAPTLQTLLKVTGVFDVALMVRFERWSKAVILMADKIVPVPFDQEYDQMTARATAERE